MKLHKKVIESLVVQPGDPAEEAAITATSTSWAHGYARADHGYECRAIVGGILTHIINHLDLRPPTVTKQQLAALNKARRALLAV